MFKELCRLCGNKNNETLSIFSEHGHNQKLELKIKQVVRLNILKEDPLPKIICVSCIKYLENASYFIDRCHQTQIYLDQLYRDSIPPLLISSFNTLNTTGKSTNDKITNEIKDTLSKSTSLDDSISKNIAVNGTSIENCNQNVSKDHDDDDTDQNYTALKNASSSTELQNTSTSQISNTKSEDDSFNGEKVIVDQVSIINENLNKISSNERRSSNDNSQNAICTRISQVHSKSTSNNRSQLKRTCTSQAIPVVNQENSSDESYIEQIELSDDNFGFDSTDDEDYEFSGHNAKKSSPKSKSLSNTNKNNSKKDVTKNSTVERSAASVSNTNFKENDTSRKEWKDKKRFQCGTCKKTFSQALTYQEHLNVHTGNRPFSCKLCTASFRRRQELNQHLRTIHSEKQFKCPSCDHVAKHKGKLTEHIKSVHDKPFACDMCDYRTGEKGKITQHIANKHTDNLSFVCEICGNGFKTKCSLHVHIRNIHFPEPKVCQICGTVCPSLARYSSHIFRCGKEKKRYPCEKCGKTYVNKEILKDHMNKHLNIKPYKCDVCGKEFFQRNRLDTHKYVHRGANYQCEICSQSFNRKDNMKNHMKRHFYKSMRYDNMIVTAV